MRSLESIIKANKEVEPGYHNPLDYRTARQQDLSYTTFRKFERNEIDTVTPQGRTRTPQRRSKTRCTYCGLESKRFKLCRDPLCIQGD